MESTQRKLLILLSSISVGFLALLGTQTVLSRQQEAGVRWSVTKERAETFSRMLDLKFDSVRNFSEDYSRWDEMITFLKTKDPTWAHDNIETSLKTYSCEWAGAFQLDGTCVYSKSSVGKPDDFPSMLTPDTVKSFADHNTRKHFFARIPAGLMEFSVSKVTRTTDMLRVDPKGYFIVGRFWTPALLRDFQKNTATHVTLINGEPKELTFLSSEDKSGFNVPLADISGNILAYLKVEKSLPMVEIVRDYVRELTVLSFVFAIVTTGALVFFMNKWVTAPIRMIALGLSEHDLGKLLPVRKSKSAFGKVANLIIEHFAQEHQLREEIVRRQQVEEQLVIAKDKALEVSKLKSSFLATMSHEIRTPMNGVLGMTDLLIQSDLEPEQRECAKAIQSSANTLMVIISDILDYSKIEAGKMSLESAPFDLFNAVRQTAKIHIARAKAKGLECDVSVPDGEFWVAGDVVRLGQILNNLMDNALKFTKEGSIGLSIQILSEGPKTAKVQFVVYDTGLGIPEDRKTAIFDSFTQVDSSTTRLFGGTGLGLAICQQLAHSMGGSIVVESELGKGSEFIVEIPFIREPAKISKGVKDAFGVSNLNGLRILLAEDNMINRMVAVKMLERVGCTTEYAANGEEAADLAATDRFDVVLMDVHMPTVDGLEATRRIREHEARTGGHIPILALSASVLEEDKALCMNAGMDGFLPKPFTIDRLVEAIRDAVEHLVA